MSGNAVARLRAAADAMHDFGQQFSTVDPGPSAFGAGGPGRLGELGRELYLVWQGAFDARVSEATAQAERLAELADATARAGDGYAEADESARRQHPEVS